MYSITEKAIRDLCLPSGTDYGTFVKNARQGAKLKHFLTKCGFKNVEAHQMYHEASAFAETKKGTLYYFRTDDDRDVIEGMELLMRTARDRKDYTGGRNQYPHRVQELIDTANEG